MCIYISANVQSQKLHKIAQAHKECQSPLLPFTFLEFAMQPNISILYLSGWTG